MARPFLCQTSSDRAPPCPFKPLFFRHAAARRFFFFFFCLRQIAFHLPNINLRNLLPSSDSATRERDSFADNTGQPSRAFNFKSQKISPLCFSRLFFSSFFSFFLSPPPPIPTITRFAIYRRIVRGSTSMASSKFIHSCRVSSTFELFERTTMTNFRDSK